MASRGPVPVILTKREAAETLKVGPLTIRVYEDGSLTQDRVSGVLIEIPAGKSGPPMHWHRFHDELFLVTKGWNYPHSLGCFDCLSIFQPGRDHAVRYPRRRC